jgi:hypothetical protein
MTRFILWLFLCAAGVIGAFFGLHSWDTARSGAWFSGVALFLHSLFGEEA